jgi:hypothetical protein
MADNIAHYVNSGSGRALNCIKIAELIQADGDEAGGPLLFQTPILNRCVLIKDIYQLRSRGGTLIQASVKTKVYLPFNPKRAEEGGQSVFFDTTEFHQAMQSLIDVQDETRREQLDNDTKTLRVLDSIPTFAPFLLKDRLDRAQIEVNYRYHDLPPAEWQRTYTYVQQRFRKILTAVLPGGEAEDSPTLDKLLSRLWGFKDPVALQLLAKAFGLPEKNSAELFYNWKGVIFLAYQYAQAKDKITLFLTWLEDVCTKPALLPEPSNRETRARLAAIQVQAEKISRDIASQLGIYEKAFEALFVTGSGAEGFRNFLLNSDSYFQTVGIDLGCLSHGAEVWDEVSHRFSQRKMATEILADLMKSLEDILFTVKTDLERASDPA